MKHLVLSLFLLLLPVAFGASETGPANSISRVPSTGGRPQFGSIDLSKSAAVGTSILAPANGGTGYATTYNAIGYGADPTGTSDSTNALQACITAAQSVGGLCYLPPTTAGYKITNTLTIGNDMALAGDSMTASSSAYNGATIFFSGSNAVPMIKADNNAGSVRISNLSLKNTGSATVGIQINRVNALIENISSNSATGFSSAVISTYQASSYTYHVTINNVYLANQNIASQTPIGIRLAGGHTLVVNNSMLTGFATGISLEAAGGSGGGIEGVSITNSHIEAFCGDNSGYPGSHAAIGVSVAGPVYGFNLTGTNFQMNGEQTSCGANQRAVTLTAVQGANIMGNHFLGGSGAMAISIAAADAKGVWIAGNSFDNFGTKSIEILSASADFSIGQNDYSRGSVVPLTYYNGLTASRALATDSSKNIVSSSVTSTELGYLSGVSSALQTQLGLKAPLASPTFSGTIGTALTASRALATDGSGNLAVSATTGTELGYLSGVSSALQTQLGLKAPLASPTFSGTIGTALTASRALATDGSGNLAVSAVTGTELGYVSGVTSALQTQLGLKAPLASPTLTGTTTTSTLNTSTLAATSTIAVGGALQSNILAYFTGNLLSGATQHMFYNSGTFSSGATTAGNGYSAALNTAAASYTLAAMSDFYALSPSLGATSAVTRFTNFRADQVTGGAANSAVLADNVAYTGYNFIHQSGTSPSSMAGALTLSASGTALTLSGTTNGDIIRGATPTQRISLTDSGFQLGAKAIEFYVATAAPASTRMLTLDSGSQITAYKPLMSYPDATNDIGASGATRFRDFYLSRDIFLGSTGSAYQVQQINGTNNHLIWASDNGGGNLGYDGTTEFRPKEVHVGTTLQTPSIVHKGYHRVAASNAGSTTINNNVSTLVLHASGTLAAYTVTMPSSPPDGLELCITSDQTITALTLSPNTSQTIVGTFASLTLGTSDCFIWVSTDSEWYPR